MGLIRVYPFRLKLLCSIPPHTLYDVLETLKKEQFFESIELLRRDLLDKPCLETISLLNSNRMADFLATLRWSLISTNCCSKKEIAFNSETITKVIEIKIPFNPSSEEITRSLIPKLIAFDGPYGARLLDQS
jgi:hypothetical protein